jgi:hypothetical protein
LYSCLTDGLINSQTHKQAERKTKRLTAKVNPRKVRKKPADANGQDPNGKPRRNKLKTNGWNDNTQKDSQGRKEQCKNL